ncbi:MAG: transporter [Planctomycetaceae bacterium]
MSTPRFLVVAVFCCLSSCGSDRVLELRAQDVLSTREPLFRQAQLVVRGQEGEAPETGEEPENPFEHHLETDRDSFTPATTTVDLGRWIVESSYSFIDNRRAADTNSFPELVMRYGLFERFELRVGWNFEVGGGGNVVSSVEGEEGLEGRKIERESRALYGFKWRFTEQVAWVPESSFIVEGFTPTSGDATATEASATYVWGWELPSDWKLDAAIRYASSTDREDDFAILNPSAVLRVPLSDRINLHGEYFGAVPHGRAGGRSQHFFSPGLHYLLTPDLEIGVRVGWGLNDASARFFTNAGVGWRF